MLSHCIFSKSSIIFSYCLDLASLVDFASHCLVCTVPAANAVRFASTMWDSICPSSQNASCVALYLKSGHLAFVCSKWNSIQQHLSALQSSQSVRCMQITMLSQLLPPNQEPGTDSFNSNHLSSRTFSDREHTYTWTATSSNMRHLESGKKAQIQNQKSSIKCRKKYGISAIFFVQTFEQTFT